MGGKVNSGARRADVGRATVTRRRGREGHDVVEAALDRVPHQLHAVVQLELAEGVLDVVLDGAVRDDQALGDLLVAEPLGDQPQHLGLAVGELRAPWARRRRRGRRVGGQPAVLAEDQAGQARGEDRVADGRAAHRVQQLLRAGRLQQIAGGARTSPPPGRRRAHRSRTAPAPAARGWRRRVPCRPGRPACRAD